MHSHMDSITGKMFTASRNTKIEMLIGIVLCPAYVSHGKMAALTDIWKFNLNGEMFFKELLRLLNSYLNEDLLFVGTMRFMDLTTMETFWGLLSCWHNSICSSQIACLVIAVLEEVSYLSSIICNEFVELMAKIVLSNIISVVKTAKYFAISVDLTPDVSHVDQLTFIVRFVDSSGKLVERFMKFTPISGHNGETMTNVVLDTLHGHDLSIMDCRGQSYDNASNMPGKYRGLQARISEVNPLDVYVPCSAHSLNLVGSCAAECCVNAISFFGFVQTLFNFFSASTHGWSILKSTIHGVVIK